jgi:sugar phosphate isomerase/epimerase
MTLLRHDILTHTQLFILHVALPYAKYCTSFFAMFFDMLKPNNDIGNAANHLPPLSQKTPLPSSIFTSSLGTASILLPTKLEAIQQAGFKTISLDFLDLVSFAASRFKHQISIHDYSSLCIAGKEVAAICKSHDLAILLLESLTHFEGVDYSQSKQLAAVESAYGWIRIMHSLGTSTLLVQANDLPDLTKDVATHVRHLQKLSDMLDEHGMRLAYEPTCYATLNNSWMKGFETVLAVDRQNLGLCLDTFQICGMGYGDPSIESGFVKDMPLDQVEKRFRASMQDLSDTVPRDLIYLLKISDAYKPQKPLKSPALPDKHKNEEVPQIKWSRDFRTLPFGEGYLPMKEVVRAVLETGARCYFALDVSDGGPAGKRDREKDLMGYAKKARQCLKRLVEECDK